MKPSSSPKKIDSLMPSIGARFYTQLDSAYLWGDMVEGELEKESISIKFRTFFVKNFLSTFIVKLFRQNCVKIILSKLFVELFVNFFFDKIFVSTLLVKICRQISCQNFLSIFFVKIFLSTSYVNIILGS